MVVKREMYAVAGDGTLAVRPIAFLLLMQWKPFELLTAETTRIRDSFRFV
jgi:hypothetical protein